MRVPAPDALCRDCGNNSSARSLRYAGELTWFCDACGSDGIFLHRDNIPFSVWLRLADNEDRAGKVPANPGWQPSRARATAKRSGTSRPSSSAAASSSPTPSSAPS